MGPMTHGTPRRSLTSAAPRGDALAAEFMPADGVDEQELIKLFMGERARQLEGEYDASDARQVSRGAKLGNLAGLERARGAAEIQMDPTVRRGRQTQFEDELPNIMAGAQAKAYPERVRGEYDVAQAEATARGRERTGMADNLSSQLEALRGQRYPKDRMLKPAVPGQPERPMGGMSGWLGLKHSATPEIPNDQPLIDQLDPRIAALERQFGFTPETFSMQEIEQEAQESGQPVEAILQELKRAGHVVR